MKIAAAAIMAFTLLSVVLLAVAALGLSAARRARMRGQQNAPPVPNRESVHPESAEDIIDEEEN